jgi:hypothetical protein
MEVVVVVVAAADMEEEEEMTMGMGVEEAGAEIVGERCLTFLVLEDTLRFCLIL